jgi:hypothetical protein
MGEVDHTPQPRGFFIGGNVTLVTRSARSIQKSAGSISLPLAVSHIIAHIVPDMPGTTN